MGIRFVLTLLIAPIAVFCQAPGDDPVKSATTAAMILQAHNRAAAGEPKSSYAKFERERFTRQFNKLISAMAEFTQEYNQAAGAVWPQKKADAIEKAFRDLRKTDSWKRAAAHADAESKTIQSELTSLPSDPKAHQRDAKITTTASDGHRESAGNSHP